MPSLVERVVNEHEMGVDTPDLLDITERKIVLARLKPLPVSEQGENDSFRLYTDLRDLIEEDYDHSTVTMNRFNNFLRLVGLGLYDSHVINVMKLLAEPKVFNRPVPINSRNELPKISDAIELVHTGVINYLDGFNVPFNLEVAQKLFSEQLIDKRSTGFL